MEASDKPIVLVTGASGYVAAWIIHVLMESGTYRVRGTVRDPSNEEKMAPLKAGYKDHYDNIEFVAADLQDSDSLKSAIEGVTYIIHVASPLPAESPTDMDKEVIQPAIDGTLGVLKNCVGTGVKKVVITSSALTIANHPKGEGLYGPDSVVEATDDMNAYYLSKIKAERAAFEFMEELESKGERTFEMSTIHPGIVSGPPLIPNVKGTALGTYAAAMTGNFKTIPQVYYSHSDVRDSAHAHVNALEKGKHLQRYAVCSKVHKMVEFFEVMKEKYGPLGYDISTNEIDDATLEGFASMSIDGKNLKWQWNINAGADGSLTETELGVKYTSMKDSIIDMCDAFINLKLIPEPTKE